MANKRSQYPTDMNFTNPDYSTFDLSHLHRTSFDMGKLVPIECQAVMPGDKFEINVEHFIRTMPTNVPIMDNVDLKINHFFVPYRVLWDKFPEWLTMNDTHQLLGQVKPEIPKFRAIKESEVLHGTKYPNGRLLDYLGLSSAWKGTPTQDYADTPDKDYFNLFPVLAYNKIFIDYYAPQRWIEYLHNHSSTSDWLYTKKALLDIKKSNGGKDWNLYFNNTSNTKKYLFEVKNVTWNNDYFTNALPTPTLFDEVRIPFLDNRLNPGDGLQSSMYEMQQGLYATVVPENGIDYETNENFDNTLKMATIRQLRENVALQHFLEQMQVGGGRYMETMKVIWGQDIPDQTLQRADYIGGDITPIFFNEVESTAGTTDNKLGDLAGKPVSAGAGDKHYFEADEFGIFMTIAHVVPKRSYSDAIDYKIWKLSEPTDLPMKHFEGIGDQIVWSEELTGVPSSEIFGYVPRYSNWKGSLDRYSGELRHTLKHWHLGSTQQELAGYTTIQPEFLKCKPRMDIFNVNDGETDLVFGVFNFDIKVKRGLSYNPNPGVSYI